MTVVFDNPWLVAFYIAAVLLGILIPFVKLPHIMGAVNLLLHTAAILVLFLFGGALEDVLLFLLFSLVASLLASYCLSRMEDKK